MLTIPNTALRFRPEGASGVPRGPIVWRVDANNQLEPVNLRPRALVSNPSLLLAGEPTGNLDSRTSVETMNVFRRLKGIRLARPRLARRGLRFRRVLDGHRSLLRLLPGPQGGQPGPNRSATLRIAMPTEPWMRGPIAGVHPFLQPLLRSFEHAREDLAAATAGLTGEQMWARPHGIASVGFHIRHIAGSVDRLLTYAQGRQLTSEQLAALEMEKQPGAGREALLDELDRACHSAEQSVRSLDPATLAEPREIGRKRLPSTVIGLLVHISEHTLRHTGQAVTTAKIVRGV